MRLRELVVPVGILALIVSAASPAFAQTSGRIRGRIQDAATGRALAGVVVVARSPALQGEQIAVSEGDGSFTVSFLPPGSYTLRFELEQYRVETMPNVEVQLGSTTPVTLDLVPVALEAERIEVTSTAPAVDRGSTEIGTNLNREFIRATPSARRYSDVLQTTPGASEDAYGTTIFGATSVENSYVVEGLNTTDAGFGRAGADMNTDFFEEIEVKTGGYLPEFGRSTGGIFNLVLRSGSNDLHGEVFFNISPGFLRADPTPIYRAGEAIGREDEVTIIDAGFAIGGPILRDRLWFFGGFNPEFRLTTVSRILQTRFDDVTQDPETGEVTADAPDGEPDLDQNLNPDVRPVPGGTEDLDRQRITYMLAGKLTFAASTDHRLSLAYFGNPYVNTGVLRAIDDDRTSNGVSGAPSWHSGTRKFGSHNVMATYTGQLLERRLQVEVFGGAHFEHDVQMPTNDAERQPTEEYVYPQPLANFEPGCPELDETPFEDCVVSDYRDGGYGFFDESLNRYTGGFRLTHLLSGHRIRYGFDTELKEYNSVRGYTGGYYGLHYGPSAADDPYAYERDSYVRQNPDDPYDIVTYGQGNEPPFEANVSTLTLSAFLQDQWEIDRYLTVNGGLRWDFEQLGGAADDSIITIGDEFAPRIGFSFDPTGRGRVRVFASWGLFYESVPLDINQRSFAREGNVFRQVDDAGNPICFDAAGNPVPGGAPPDCTFDPYTTFDDNGDGQFSPDEYHIYGGTDSLVSNDLQGQFHEEFVVGGEVEFLPNWVAGLSVVAKRLGRVIEDISPDDGVTFVISNPGDNDCNVPEAQRDAMADVCGEDANDDGTISPDEYDEDATVFPEPTREYLGLVFSVRKRLSDHSQLLASYTLSRNYGDYPGLYAPDNDQLDPNLSTQYDLVGLLPNRLGLLPNDHTHSVKLAGSYELGGLTPALRNFTFGLAYTGESGSPYSYLGRHQFYGRLEAFILPRGSAGRTPFIHTVDVALGYDIPLTSTIKLNFNATVFNILNFQKAILVDQEYTTDVVNPIRNCRGSSDDCLAGLENSDGEPASVNPTFGEARLRQAPLSVRLGARLTF